MCKQQHFVLSNFEVKFSCFVSHTHTATDPGPQFLRAKNRELLKSLTRLDIGKVYHSRPTPKNKYNYHFLTRQELQSKFEGALRNARRMLQMPPIVKQESDAVEVLARDPELQGLEEGKIIITDISYRVKDSDRTILVRQPDGTLETAPPEIRRRMNQTFFPREERRVIVPKLFDDAYLKRCLDEGRYEHVLDRACQQFEPYDKDFHRVTAITYQHINDNNAFDTLRSTRHFGPFAFFLAWHRIIDNLLLDCIRRDYLRSAVEAICLSYNLNNVEYDAAVLDEIKRHPERNDEYYYRKLIEAPEDAFDTEQKIRFEIEKTVGKTADEIAFDEILLQFIEKYAKSRAIERTEVAVALRTYREEFEEKRKLLEGLHKAHGVSV